MSVIKISVINPRIESKKYVSFEIETVISGEQHISIRQRYSKLMKSYKLWKQLLEKRDSKKLPDLPKLSMFSRFNEKNVEVRRSAMEECLNKCAKIPYLLSSKYFQEFLGVLGHFKKEVLVEHIRKTRLAQPKMTSSLTSLDSERIRKMREKRQRNVTELRKSQEEENKRREEEYDPLVMSQLRSLKQQESRLKEKEDEINKKKKEFEQALMLFESIRAKFMMERKNFEEERKKFYDMKMKWEEEREDEKAQKDD